MGYLDFGFYELGLPEHGFISGWLRFLAPQVHLALACGFQNQRWCKANYERVAFDCKIELDGILSLKHLFVSLMWPIYIKKKKRSGRLHIHCYSNGMQQLTQMKRSATALLMHSEHYIFFQQR